MNESMFQIIENETATSFVSAASLWEISIKCGLGKLKFKQGNHPNLPKMLEKNGFEILAIEWQAMRNASLLERHHNDPFDRLIIAESLNRNLPVISCDSKFDLYGANRLW